MSTMMKACVIWPSVISNGWLHADLAHSGCAGIELARAQPFDLVALDHIMPGMGGLEALGHLMALPSPPAVIYVTGSDETGVAVAALKAGAVDYVVKTGSGDFFELLTSTLHQALGTLRLRKQKEQVEMQLRETNAQLEALLHEMNHRVANSLQMVSSLVSLQTRRATGRKRAPCCRTCATAFRRSAASTASFIPARVFRRSTCANISKEWRAT
jgi:CheY-like chemotaxis protein